MAISRLCRSKLNNNIDLHNSLLRSRRLHKFNRFLPKTFSNKILSNLRTSLSRIYRMSSNINSFHRLLYNLNRYLYNKQLQVLHRQYRKLAQMEISLINLKSLWVPQNTKITRNNWFNLNKETTFKKVLTVGSNLMKVLLLKCIHNSIRSNQLTFIALRL